MPAGFEWDTFGAFTDGLNALANLDATPLMERWEEIIVEGNRRGVLSGVDGYNRPEPPLKYRFGIGKRTRNRQRPAYGSPVANPQKADVRAFRGPFAAGWDDNLLASQYAGLTGPRLAPRGEQSRAIKNLMTRIDYDPSTHTWSVIGAWAEVVSAEGFPFLPVHFEGLKAGRGAGFTMPKYDLRPVRPEDLQFARNALMAFIRTDYLERF